MSKPDREYLLDKLAMVSYIKTLRTVSRICGALTIALTAAVVLSCWRCCKFGATDFSLIGQTIALGSITIVMATVWKDFVANIDREVAKLIKDEMKGR